MDKNMKGIGRLDKYMDKECGLGKMEYDQAVTGLKEKENLNSSFKFSIFFFSYFLLLIFKSITYINISLLNNTSHFRKFS